MADADNPDAPVGKARKYARPECERRFLLARLPDQPVARIAVITDRYLAGTRLRVRCMVETVEGRSATVYKLTQKIPAAHGTPGLITTMSLSEAEYGVFAALPAGELRKTRYRMPPLGVDVFGPPLHGLVTAEAEFASEEEMLSLPVPSFAVAEVTRDLRFTGGRLAASSRDEVREALADYGVAFATEIAEGK